MVVMMLAGCLAAPVAAPAPVAAAPVEYQIGDTGPGGGLVFYDKGEYSDGWRYLEAVPQETEFTAQWGAYGKNLRGTETSVGSGKSNTEFIVDYLRRIGESGKAAQLCMSLDFGGYKDWFLPSLDELDLMYQNLKAKGLGNFSQKYYWSSSEYNYDYFAWYQKFFNGGQVSEYKNNSYAVRAIRAF
jgi:hypothetical protein